MKSADHLLLGTGAAQQEFDLHIPFLQIDRAHHGVKASFR